MALYSAQPVHWAGATGAITSFLDRAFYADLSGAADASIEACGSSPISPRAGTTATWDQVNKYFG